MALTISSHFHHTNKASLQIKHHGENESSIGGKMTGVLTNLLKNNDIL